MQAPSKIPAPARNDAQISPQNRAARKLLQQWLADESGYDEAAWPALKAALQANRANERSLFAD